MPPEQTSTTPARNFWDKNKTWIIIVIVLFFVASWLISTKNSFVVQGEAITAQWAQVENQYQRRFDLIPNLEGTIKGLTAQEQTVFGDIAKARTQYSGATTTDQKAQAATQVESALGRLLVITENYPTLQSSQSFQALMVSLEGTENRISVERQKYNDLVRVFDTNVKTFPTSLVASIFGVTPHAYFDVPAANQVAPKIDFTQ